MKGSGCRLRLPRPTAIPDAVECVGVDVDMFSEMAALSDAPTALG